MIRTAPAVLALALAAGCSGGAAASRTSATQTPAVSAAPSPTAPALLTVAQAGKTYLAGVADSNRTQSLLIAQLKKQPPSLPLVKAAAITFADSLRSFSLFLARTPWPAAAAADAVSLRASVAKEESAVRSLSRVTSQDDLISAANDFLAAGSASGGAVELMRQDIGLPSAN